MKDRVEFAEDWYNRGCRALDNENVFEAYIYLWLSLTIAAKQHVANNGRLDSDNDEIRDVEHIVYWMENYGKPGQIIRILKLHQDDIMELCDRVGTESSDPLIDINSRRYYEQILKFHRDFVKYWQEGATYIEEYKVARTFLELLNRVRNNLFHGGKSFKVSSDRRLLELLCPSLKSISKLCIDQAR